jgi:N-acetylglucosamine-6-phosphate deacetylase
MTTLLIHRARCIALMDDANTELNDASLLLKDGRIERIIPADENIDELLKQVDEVIDARRHVVVPGLINTEFSTVLWEGKRGEDFIARTPLGRLGTPEDMAGVALFLASPFARWVTGQTIAVDGGQVLSA